MSNSMLLRKLQDRSGASILMALLSLLFAVMVSAVILTSAVTAGQNVREKRLQQQAYLTVSSAAQLAGAVLSESEYTLSRAVPALEGSNMEVTGELAGLIERAVNYVMQFSVPYTETVIFSAANMEDVQAVFTMNTNYGISVEFSLLQAAVHNSRMTLCLNAVKNDDVAVTTDESGTLYTITTTNIVWGMPEITAGGTA